MRTGFFVAAFALVAALPAVAQYGGRPGDVVIYMFTSKGTGAIQTAPKGTSNTAPGLQIINPDNIPRDPFPPEFPGEYRLLLHQEPDDVFEYLFETQDIIDPNTETTSVAKVLIGEGMLRISPIGEDSIDAPATFYTEFPQFINIAPHGNTTTPYRLVFWTPGQNFPIAIPAPITFVSPVPPPGVSGPDYIVSLGVFPALIAWQGLNRVLPNAGWEQGIDAKVLGADTATNTTARIMRLRPGRISPPFSVSGNTHIIVLQGSVQIGPAGGASQTLTPWQYAFVPPGYNIALSNPAVYAGPGASN
jgi:hypothetical protein